MEISQVIDGLVETGARAAFHGAPADGVQPLTTAIALGQANESTLVVAQAKWLLGVCYASSGEFSAAEDVLQELLPHDADESQAMPRLEAALAATTLASIRRQQHRYLDAQDLDEWALTLDPVGAAFDARIGLAADRVGQADPSGAAEYLDWAVAVIADDDWRQRVRAGWVQCEISLLLNEGEQARDVALRAAHVAQQAEAGRHVSKSLLFAGVAARSCGDPSATDLLAKSGELASNLGLQPILEVLAVVAAEDA